MTFLSAFRAFAVLSTGIFSAQVCLAEMHVVSQSPQSMTFSLHATGDEAQDLYQKIINYNQDHGPNYLVKQYITLDQGLNIRCTKTRYASKFECEIDIHLNAEEYSESYYKIRHSIYGKTAVDLEAVMGSSSGSVDSMLFSCHRDPKRSEVCKIEMNNHFNEELDRIPTK